MKKLLVFFLLACGLDAAGQAAPKPFQKANAVVVQTPDSAAVALRKLATVFVAQGYTVDKLDKDFLTLTLAPKTLASSFSPVLTVRASAAPVANSVIRLTGEVRATVMNRLLNDVAQFSGSEKGIYTTGFRALEKAALAYPMGKVSYAKQ